MTILVEEAKTVVAGATPTVIVTDAAIETIVAVCIPGVGGTMLCEYTTSPRSMVKAGTAKWAPSPSGTVSARSEVVFNAPITAIRFSATTTDGWAEVLS